MKKLASKALILCGIGVFFSFCRTDRNHLETGRFLIDSIQSQWVPDSRTGVFSIKATMTGDQLLLTGKTSDASAHKQLLDHLNKQDIPYIDSILMLPDTALGAKLYGLTTLSVANIRYNPSQSAEMATQALMGTPVKVLQENNGYYLIQTPDQYISWTESAGLSLKTEAEMKEWKSADRVIFTEDFGLVYELPDAKSNPVSDLVMGGILVRDTGPEQSSGFVRVLLPDGRRGWVKVDQCKDLNNWIQEVSLEPGSLTGLSRQFLGRPYLWGGTSVKAFDCSGYTKTIYFMGGWILSRDASQQVLQGEEVGGSSDWHNLQPGDLLFFGRKATEEKPERATHVGFYLGDSYFIHCSGMVRINSLDSLKPDYRKYYQDIFLRARRIIPAGTNPMLVKNHPWYF